MKIKRGRLIVIEGTDGSGKATQVNLLNKKLLREGYDSKTFDFPQYGENIFADTIAAYLRNELGNAVDVQPHLTSLSYAADRWKSSPEIRDDISRGRIVVTNRYTSASLGHQAAKFDSAEERQDYREWLRKIEFGTDGFNIPQPDVVIFLVVDPIVAQKLITAKPARNYTGDTQLDSHERDLEYQKKSLNSFMEVAQGDPRWIVIDCMNSERNDVLPPKEIAEKVWGSIRPFLPILFNQNP